MKNITFKVPFNRHGHLRELLTLLRFVLPYVVKQYWGMVVMPNLTIAVTTWQQAQTYLDEIRMVLREQGLPSFELVMTAYLTDNTDPENVLEGYKRGIWKAVKLYPHGATTNSDKGVTKLSNIFHVLEMMQKNKIPLLVHPETDSSRPEIPFLDKERVYTEESLTMLHREFPELIISVEHVSTKEATQFVEEASDHVTATVTPHHMLYNHDAIFHGGVAPYTPGAYVENVCQPVLKYQSDVDYLCNAIMTGRKKHKFGAGDDDAWHTEVHKHEHRSRCGVAHIASVEAYAMAFEGRGMFESDRGIKIFENFMSVNNLHILGLTPLTDTITLLRQDQIVPALVEGNVRPFKAGQTIPWTLQSRT
jgi:dihydroorotase